MGISRVTAAGFATVALAGIASWVLASEGHAPVPSGNYAPRPTNIWKLTGPGAAAARAALIERATVRSGAAAGFAPLPDFVECRFVRTEPTGTSAKFDCVIDGGELVKVKYGRNPEIHAEVAASRLLQALGFPSDRVDLVGRVRCHGCPRYPFFTMRFLSALSATGLVGNRGVDGYTDFEWVSVERRFPAPAVETDDREGWAWWELPPEPGPRGELDALRLLAVFLAHWDNKAENQRLVCLDDPADAADRASCVQPLLVLQDLGATFGPPKMNLARWRALPIWSDPDRCVVSMARLPWNGATFADAQISEEGRAALAAALSRLDDTEVRAIFAEARVPDYQVTTDDGRDLQAWGAAFRERANQILNAGPCPAVSS